MKKEQRNLVLQQVLQALQNIKKLQDEHAQQLQQTRVALGQLAALQDLEFIESLNDWVSKKKWNELKGSPR